MGLLHHTTCHGKLYSQYVKISCCHEVFCIFVTIIYFNFMVVIHIYSHYCLAVSGMVNDISFFLADDHLFYGDIMTGAT